MACQSLVRPRIEYVTIVCNSPILALTKQVEMVQHWAVRYATQHFHNTSSISSKLQDLGWKALQDSQRDARMVMLYKVVNDLVAFSTHEYVTPALAAPETLSPTHARPSEPKIYPYKFSFFPRIIREWNCLPSRVITAETVSRQFKTELAKVSPTAGPIFTNNTKPLSPLPNLKPLLTLVKMIHMLP